MKGTLLGPLPKVNTDVETRQGSSADSECVAAGPSGPTPDPGQSPLGTHLTTAWEGSDASLGFLAGSLSADITGQTGRDRRLARVHTRPGHAK